MDAAKEVTFTGKEERKRRRKARRKEMKKLTKAQMMEEGIMNQEEREREREKNMKKRRRARERKKEVRKQDRERRERKKEFRKKLQERRERNFAEMEHQSRMAPTAKTPKILKDFHEIWTKEEFDLVHGPNLNPECITWKELSISPSVKVKEEEVKKEKY